MTKPTEVTERVVETIRKHETDLTEHEATMLKEFKRNVLGETDEDKKRRKKRKGPKGPNPLSCKKKKEKQPGSNNEKEKSDEKRRKRNSRRRKTTKLRTQIQFPL